VFISVSVILSFSVSTTRILNSTQNFLKSKQGYFTSESGAEDAMYRLSTGKNTPANIDISLNGTTASTQVSDIGSGEKEIVSIGDANGLVRKITTKLSVSAVGVSFNYGIQVGAGGFTMDNGSGICGNVYVNGSITGNGLSKSFITGTAIAANSISTQVDQSNTAHDSPVSSITFGKTSGTQDTAQSFTSATTSPLNKISVYIKKVSTPGNLTVRLLNDNAGAPGTQITSGTLLASSVTTNYGWVDVTFSTNPELIKDSHYWLVLDGGTSSSRYYLIEANTSGYAGGTAKIGQYGSSWNNTSPSGLDTFFKIYVGGMNGAISGVKVGVENANCVGYVGSGDIKAHTVTNSATAGTLYCQTGSGNEDDDGDPKSCNTSLPDPGPKEFAISEANINQWKEDAEAGVPIVGNYNFGTSQSVGPKKITGNVTTTNNITLTLTGTLWITGTFTPGNGTIITLDPAYGSNSGIIVVDGKIDISNLVNFTSPNSDAFILLLTTSDCPNGAGCGGAPALNVSNNVGAVLLDARNGTLHFNNNSSAKEATGSRIELSPGAIVKYDSGLIDASFSSGPGGSFQVEKWRETQ